jgi:iron complex outermembrane receptor protein
VNAASQTRLAEFETRTPGYDLVNAEVVWLLPFDLDVDLALYLKGQNLLDEDIRNSTSLLKDQAPQIGRNYIFGIRAEY